jgi:pilus assembly protein Flp/PilA
MSERIAQQPLVMWLKARMNITSERGAAAAEYALLIALIAVAIIAGAGLLGTNIGAKLDSVAKTIAK